MQGNYVLCDNCRLKVLLRILEFISIIVIPKTNVTLQ